MIAVDVDKHCPAYLVANEELSMIVTDEDEPEIDVYEEITSVD